MYSWEPCAYFSSIYCSLLIKKKKNDKKGISNKIGNNEAGMNKTCDLWVRSYFNPLPIILGLMG